MSIFGAIIGDIMGSRYEFANTFDYNFEPFALSLCLLKVTAMKTLFAAAIIAVIALFMACWII